MTERPRSLAHRFEIERRKLLSAWKTIVIGERNGVIIAIAGSVEAVPGTIRDFRIDVSPRYPYEPPRAFAVGWSTAGLHCYSHTEMCLWRPEQWSPKYTLAYAVAKTFTWIHKFEVYIKSGEWPGTEQLH